MTLAELPPCFVLPLEPVVDAHLGLVEELPPFGLVGESPLVALHDGCDVVQSTRLDLHQNQELCVPALDIRQENQELLEHALDIRQGPALPAPGERLACTCSER